MSTPAAEPSTHSSGDISSGGVGPGSRLRLRMHVAAIIRESASAALSQRVASAVTVAIIGALCCVVLLTTGRTVGAENAVLTSIDTTGTRSIIVRATAASGLDTTVLARLADVDGIEWAGAFGPASDVTNAAFSGGNRVSLRTYHAGVWGAPPGASSRASSTEPAVEGFSPRGTVDSAAARALALADGVGTVVPVGGALQGDSHASAAQPASTQPASTQPASAPQANASSTTVSATDVFQAADPPSFLRFLEPTVLVPAPTATAAPSPVAVLVVLARTPAQVHALAAVVSSVLGVRDTSTATVTTSEQLAALRGVVQQQLGGFSQSLVAIVFGATALVVSSMLFALVMLRRRDFGRRRALGATRLLVVELLLVQVALLAVVGSALGSCAASVALLVLADPLPTPSFFVALAVLATLTGIVSAIVPAVAASRRDPLRELRVP